MRSAFSAFVCLLLFSAFGLTSAAQQKPADACADISCPANNVCYEGGCFPTSFEEAPAEDVCAGVICPVGQVCYEGGCFTFVDTPTDPCADVSCPANNVCYEGGCFPTSFKETPAEDVCADVICPVGQVCYEGGCFEEINAPDTDVTCPEGSIEKNGSCKLVKPLPADPCADVICPSDQVCYEGGCFTALDAPEDPCAGVLCPASMVCYEGGCFESLDPPTDPCADVSCPANNICYEGGCFPSIDTPSNTCADVSCPANMACYQGGCFPELVTEARMPQLSYSGRTQSFTMPPLSYAGAQKADTPATRPQSGLEIIPLPTGARKSTYLSIDDATLARDENLRITYSGLPEKEGRIVLFYMGGSTPRALGNYYTRANTPDGVYEREGLSLPPSTGPYKACVGFQPDTPREAKSPDAYADCVDFVVASAGSRDAKPVLSLSEPEPKAGKRFIVSWSRFPPVNAAISLVDLRTGASLARRYSSSRPAGEWELTVREPGTYEFQIYFEGEALRARMPLEVTK